MKTNTAVSNILYSFNCTFVSFVCLILIPKKKLLKRILKISALQRPVQRVNVRVAAYPPERETVRIGGRLLVSAIANHHVGALPPESRNYSPKTAFGALKKKTCF